MDIGEALATALTYEHKVRDHYVKCAQKVVDPKGHKIFATLASEEQSHVDFLEKRQQELKSTGALQAGDITTLVPPREKLQEEIKKLRAVPAHGSTAAKAEIDFLKEALELERQTSSFYGRMFDEMDATHRPLFARFLEIEQGHLLIVQAEIDALAGHGHWFDFMEFTLEG